MTINNIYATPDLGLASTDRMHVLDEGTICELGKIRLERFKNLLISWMDIHHPERRLVTPVGTRERE